MKTLLFGISAMMLVAGAAMYAADAPAEGTKAPAFDLPRDGGATVSLSDYAGQKLVLFFYPRADTPGCTKEAIDFTRLATAFADSIKTLGDSLVHLKVLEVLQLTKYLKEVHGLEKKDLSALVTLQAETLAARN